MDLALDENDYLVLGLEKPVDTEVVLASLKRAVEKRRLIPVSPDPIEPIPDRS